MKDTAWQSSAQTGNMTPKIDGSHAACKELWSQVRTYTKATVGSCATEKMVSLGNIKASNEISYVKSRGTKSVTKVCNNPEKGIR